MTFGFIRSAHQGGSLWAANRVLQFAGMNIGFPAGVFVVTDCLSTEPIGHSGRHACSLFVSLTVEMVAEGANVRDIWAAE